MSLPGREPSGALTRRTPMSSFGKFLVRAGLAVGLMVAVTACGSSSPDDANDPAADAPATSAPTPGAPDGKVTGLGMVIDQGDGAQLCLGPIAESYPPQCKGFPLEGWDWSGRDDFEDISGVKFAMYAVTGTFDGTSMTVTDEPIAAALYDPMPDPSAARATGTPCPVPDGGWVISNRAKSNANALERAERTAAQLDGYVTNWNDQFSGLDIAVSEETEPDPDPDMGDDGSLDPLKLVLNVQVTGDVDVATQLMRTVWGGALCVSNPQHTEAELTEISDSLADAPGVTDALPQYDRVVVNVLYDDGSLQQWADDTYGENTVVVISSLHSAT